MKKREVPQDFSALENVTKELCYAIGNDGKYDTALSSGWEVKATALDVAWNDIDKRVKDAAQKIKNGTASPLLYYVELKLMELPILAAYTGFWQWQIKRHFKPDVFKNLSEKK